MITGFNTDIEFQGTTYHVQTEDKGVKTPLILSLVYDRGTILASKRSTYNDLLTGNLDEKVLAERLQKQHNLICAAIRTGRIEDLKRMTTKEAAKQNAVAHQRSSKSPGENKSFGEAESSPNAARVTADENQTFAPSNFENENASSNASADADDEFALKSTDEIIWDVPVSIVEEPLVEAVQIMEELILPAEAVEIIADYAGNQAVIDNKLKTRLLTDEKLKSGDRKTLRIAVNRGNPVKALSGAQVIIKILGSSFRPLIFHAQTDSNGIATVHLQLPQFRAGRAALLIKAISDGEEADLRRIITHN